MTDQGNGTSPIRPQTHSRFSFLSALYILRKKEKVAGIASYHLREDFPPHPDDPPRRKIKRIVPYPPLRFKGGRRNLDVISRDEIHLRIQDERTRRELEGETSPETWESKNEALRRLGLRTIANPKEQE